MTEGSAIPAPDADTAKAIEKALTSDGSAKAFGGAIGTLMATGGQLLGGGWGAAMTIFAPLVTLIAPTIALSRSDAYWDWKDDRRWKKTAKHLTELKSDPTINPEDKPGIDKTLAEARTARAEKLLERAKRKPRRIWSSTE
ncbi:hypothetical protein ACGFY3_31515 [Streptomyces mirabilis]|uniref:hypothetical protein n=1 Tax=Streptomyces mirabilis TaxID=68239 RepID=UPI00371837D4